MRNSNDFTRLISLLRSFLPGAEIPHPATEAELRDLQIQLGKELPEGLIAAYRICNGSPRVPDDPLAENLFYSYRFLTVNQVRELAIGLDNTRRSEVAPVPRDPIPSIPVDSVQDLRTSSDWVAFADDRAGGYLAIDYSPGPHGVIGQVINFGRDDTIHFQLATSFDLFVERVLFDYAKSRHHYFFGDTTMFIDRLIQKARSAQ